MTVLIHAHSSSLVAITLMFNIEISLNYYCSVADSAFIPFEVFYVLDIRLCVFFYLIFTKTCKIIDFII